MSRKRILLVDDEPDVLKAIERVIRSALDADVVLATSGKEALDRLEKEPFDVLVADIMMPEMNGMDLLHIVQELYPRTIRLAFSGWASEEVAYRTAGTVHQFLKKPGDLLVLGGKIQAVLNLRRMLPEEGLERVVTCVKSLPALPALYHELETELVSSDPSLERIGKVIEQDIAMSAKILQLVNSAFFGLREQVTSPFQAVSLLGVNIIRSLVLAFHVFGAWEDRRGNGFDPHELWRHSLNVAALARRLAQVETFAATAIEEAYVAGMFHDVGKLILAENLPDSWTAIDNLIIGKGFSRLAAERDVLGATHAEAGAYLLALWGFTDSVVKGVAFHHAPGPAAPVDSVPVAALVHVANAWDYETRGVSSEPQHRLDEAALQSLGLAQRLAIWRERVGSGWTQSA